MKYYYTYKNMYIIYFIENNTRQTIIEYDIMII